MNLVQLTANFHAAVAIAELANSDYKLDRENRHLVARFLRALRRCDRLRRELKNMVETGTL